MAEQLRVGVIGAGNMGRHHARNYSEMPQAELIAISDPEESAGEMAELYGATYYKDYAKMLEECELDAVSIAVPTLLHHQIASKTLGHKVHTLIEKPIASTPKEAEELIDIAEKKNVVLTVGHIERYNPVISELKKIIDSGQLGEISSIIAQRLGGFPKNEPETDVIIDLAIHDIDIMRYLMDEEGELLGVHGSDTFHSKEADSAEILMRFNGASGFIQANWITPVKVRRISVTGSRGYVEANYITQEVNFYQHMAIRRQNNFEDFVKKLGEPEVHTIEVDRTEPLRKELESFLMAASGKKPELLVSPIEATTALRMALKAAKEMNKGLKDDS